MGSTSIEWTDRSVNPIRARFGERTGHHCVKVSAGCANCYASRLQSRFRMPPFQADQRRDVEVFFDETRLLEVLRRRTPTKWFWCDMSDLFGEWVPDAWIDRCFAVMALTPQHTHQVLTKRPARMRAYANTGGAGVGKALADLVKTHPAVGVAAMNRAADFNASRERSGFINPWPLPNVWAGTSIEDQPTADQRIPELLATPAAVRFVSAEPLLGPVDLRPYLLSCACAECGPQQTCDEDGCCVNCGADALNPLGLDLVIAGGESGPKARPCRVEWIRSVVQQCQAAGSGAFVKQMGSLPLVPACRQTHHDYRFGGGFATYVLDSRFWRWVLIGKGNEIEAWPPDLRVRDLPGGAFDGAR